jgi:uncharacterized membrane protein YphA (DoxX/SURF4 family)
VALADLPLRASTGGFLVWSGLRTLQRPRRGDALLTAAAHSAPALEDVFGAEPARFARLVGAAQLGLGAWVVSGAWPRASGLALATYAAGPLSLLFTVPGNRATGSSWEPSERGTALAKDVWLLGAGLSLALRRPRRS